VVKVTLKNDGLKYLLTVVDDGIGLPYNVGINNTNTLGLQLVNSIRNQLEGELDVYIDHGTAFNISFDDVEYKERV
jgi:two-component sensor histidine kinase